MGRIVIRSWPDQSGDNVVIQIEDDGNPLAHVILDAASVEKHIHDLAKDRSQLKEGVTPRLEMGSRLETILNPHWHGPDFRLDEGRILSVRHPGLGWVS